MSKIALVMAVGLFLWAAFYIVSHPVNPVMHSITSQAAMHVESTCPYHPELPFDRDVEQQKRNPGFGTSPEFIANVERLRATKPNDMGLFANNQRALMFIISWQNNIQQPKNVEEALYLESEMKWFYDRTPYQFHTASVELDYMAREAFVQHWIKSHYC